MFTQINKKLKPRYCWQYVGSDHATLSHGMFDIIDTTEGVIVENHNSPTMTRYRLKMLNADFKTV